MKLEVNLPDGEYCNGCVFLGEFKPLGMMWQFRCRYLGGKRLENRKPTDYDGHTGNKVKDASCPTFGEGSER